MATCTHHAPVLPYPQADLYLFGPDADLSRGPCLPSGPARVPGSPNPEFCPESRHFCRPGQSSSRGPRVLSRALRGLPAGPEGPTCPVPPRPTPAPAEPTPRTPGRPATPPRGRVPSACQRPRKVPRGPGTLPLLRKRSAPAALTWRPRRGAGRGLESGTEAAVRPPAGRRAHPRAPRPAGARPERLGEGVAGTRERQGEGRAGRTGARGAARAGGGGGGRGGEKAASAASVMARGGGGGSLWSLRSLAFSLTFPSSVSEGKRRCARVCMSLCVRARVGKGPGSFPDA